MGGAPRGENKLSAGAEPKASPRGRGSRRKQTLTAIACTDPRLWEPRPRGESKLPAGAERKASPRGRASHKEKKAHSHSLHGPALVGAAPPRRKQTPCRRRAKSFAPRPGLPQRKQKLAAIARTDPLLWEPRPRGESNLLPAQSEKLRPEVGPPTKKTKAHTHSLHGPAFVGAAPPRRKQSPAGAEPKASPRGRASHRKQKLTAMVCTDPRLWESRPRGESNLLPAQSKSFAPRSGLPQKTNAHGHSLHGHTPAGPELNLQDKMHAQLHRIPV